MDRSWVRRLRGAILMGLTWGVMWALGGILIGVTSRLLPGAMWDAFFRVFDAPLPALAIPGFVGGVLFSAVLGVAGRHRRLEELSMSRFVLWGGAAGALLSLVPIAVASDAPRHSAAELAAMLTAPLALFCAASAAGTLALARRAEPRRLHPSPDATE